MSESIYSVQPRSAPVWSTGSVTLHRAAPRTCAATIHTSTTIATSHDATLLAILDAPLAPGEPAHVGFARKERELGTALGALPILDQRTLHARLSNPRTGDTLAEKFGRLTPERRQRLLNFLADARRRAAIAAAKGSLSR